MDKTSHFAVHADASFALRGFLSGTSVYSRMDRGCQKQQSLEPPRGCGTVMKLPYGCSFLPENSQPMSSIHGSRGIHVTRTLSESTRGVVSNRPLSPHLPVKKPQLRATFSISHRIFGASLASAILLIPIAWKFSLLLDV
ncbi:succinate dehydrogenase subunit 3-1, mitochondrial [Musa acuminata AAA Group]|uniref:succinate dehydrogenase subunit 3-1, mitochondrial n=1 Tax=Musa acuminata AAA Group TaxID=214697 RepID=UPI0031DF6B87